MFVIRIIFKESLGKGLKENVIFVIRRIFKESLGKAFLFVNLWKSHKEFRVFTEFVIIIFIMHSFY